MVAYPFLFDRVRADNVRRREEIADGSLTRRASSAPSPSWGGTPNAVAFINRRRNALYLGLNFYQAFHPLLKVWFTVVPPVRGRGDRVSGG